MYFDCPSCSKTFAVESAHLGQVVACPHCQTTIQIPAGAAAPAAPAPSPAPAPAPGPTKRCPLCGETILKTARRCKFCKTDIPQGFDEESATNRSRAKESRVAQQAADKDRELPYAVRGWFQVPTIVAAALTLIFIVAAVIGFSLGDRSPLFFLGPVGMIFGIICGVVALILVVRDLLAIKYFGRRTPLKGAKAFLGGLSAKRYRFAYYCLLDADKDESLRLRPALPKFGVEAESFSFEQFEGFKTYWKNLLHKGGTQATLSNLRVVRTEGDLALVSANLKLTRQSTGGFLALGVIESAPVRRSRYARGQKALSPCERPMVRRQWRDRLRRRPLWAGESSDLADHLQQLLMQGGICRGQKTP